MRTRRRTSSAVRPSAAASATCCAASRRPAGSATAPARMSSPASRRLAPRFNPGGTMTAPSSTRQSSCMNTVSAPPGIGAPVKMRMASPALSAWLAAWPAATRSTMASRRLALALEIVGAHRVAVDRRIIERRQIDRSDDILGKHAARGLPQRHPLASAHLRNALADQALGLGDRQEAGRKRRSNRR